MMPTSCRLLLVEDNPADLRLVQELLREMPLQCTVSHAITLGEALEYLEKEKFDVAVLDLGLPDSQGNATVTSFVNVAPSIPILVLTCNNDEELAGALIVAGAQDYLVKQQFDGRQLGRAIRYAIERKRISEQVRENARYARSLIEASLAPMVMISADGTIADANEATIRILGVARDRLIGTDFEGYFTEPEAARQSYQQVLAEGFVINHPLTINRRDGCHIEVSYNAAIYRDTRSDVQGVLGTMRDMTTQRSAEAQIAAQRRRELERLAELEHFQKLIIGRELKMIELKKEIKALKREIEELKMELSSKGGDSHAHCTGEKVRAGR